MKQDRILIDYILECIGRLACIREEGKSTFLTDWKSQDAALRNLQTMTESTQRLSKQLKAEWPTLPWRRMSAFRNVVTHNYMGMDLELIWSIIDNDTPSLAPQIDAIKRALYTSDDGG